MSENHFDTAAATWDENPVRRELVNAIAGGIRSHLSPTKPMRILDFGCGTGNLSVKLADVAGEIIAIDTSRGMTDEFTRKLAASPELREKITVRQMDFPEAELAGRGFDLICVSMVLHHIDDYSDILRKLVGCLTPGGKIAIADLFEEDGEFHQDMVVPHNGFDPQKLAEILQKCGCGENTFSEIYKLGKPVKNGTIREFPIFLLVAALPAN
jgi:2-polyprenyl-3-methyl-5-hydroxy-6-metoxy-1,4-benzoquinol methylase